MKHMKKAVLFAAICCMAFAGCGSADSDAATEQTESTEIVETQQPVETEEIVPTETQEEIAAPTDRNPLTGEAMDEALVAQRPVSCMVGNTTAAMPQYGTSNADVIVEAPAEGGLTRIMTVYQDYADLPMIMSVRSCRHYFAYLSNEFESIYVHYGQAIYATEMLKMFDDLNGLDGDLANVTFYRDESRKVPHNSYINGESIIAGIKKREYRTNHAPNYKNTLTFAEENQDLENGKPAAVMETGYPVNKPWFVYNEETGLYDRFQYGAPHTDGGNGEQLSFKNVIFRTCEYTMEPDGKYLDIKTASYGGYGKYFTNGKYIDIGWIKPVEDGICTYFDASGNEIKLNPGKTFICIILKEAEGKVGIYETKADFEAKK